MDGQGLSQRGFSRRSLMATVAAAAAAGRIPRALAADLPNLKGKRMTYASWGGAYQDGQKSAYCDPFAAATGAVVDQDGPISNAKFRLMIKTGKVVWDAADIGGNLMAAAIKEGLLEKLDFSKIDAKSIDPRYVSDYGIGDEAYSYNLGYNTDAFKGRPTPKTWADLWDLKTFPGKRMFTNSPTSMVEMALVADGVAPDKLYPLDITRALNKMDAIKDSVLWWDTNSQSQQLLNSGEASCGIINNGRVYDSAQKGAPVALSWEQPLLNVDYLVIPKGAENVDVAMAFIDFCTRPDVQAAFANGLPFAPTNPAAFAKIDPKMAPWLSTNPAYAKSGIVVNTDYWRDNLASVQRRWDQWRLS